MGRPMRKKGESGAATAYISRKQALKKLQLSLKDFRRLCIIKGIYPVEPKHKKKANKNNSTNKTYYYLKDINFLSHEPLIDKFREFRVFIRRLTRAIGRKDQEASHRLRENEPIYTLDHIVKERYPTLVDALRDLDDAVSMCFLFSTFPKIRRVKVELIELCRRLTVEFMNYVIASRSLRKVFFSIKGIYYQAEIMGQLVTWVIPHSFGYKHPTDVDFKIMVTFTDFYSTLLGFVNCHLYHSLNLIYPPKLCVETSSDMLLEGEDNDIEVVASLNQKLMAVSEDNIDDAEVDEFPELEESEAMKEYKLEQEKVKKQKKLFEGCKIFINREVPRESLVFVIRAFGGEVSYDKTLFPGSTFDESDLAITHQIVDRPMTKEQYMNRYYVQPQWVYDCVNARLLLPVEPYYIGVMLPPHLSPFVQEKEGDYIPPERQALLDMQSGITTGARQAETDSEEEQDIWGSDAEDKMDSEDSGVENESITVKAPVKRSLPQDDNTEPKKPKMKVTVGAVQKEDAIRAVEKQKAEEKRLAVMMIPKKKKHLYDKIVFGQKRRNREAQKLKTKREEYEKEQKKLKKSKIKDMS